MREKGAAKDFGSTGHLMGDLQGRTARGGVVTVAAQGAKFALNMLGMAALGRLLLPADFGLVAMVSAFTGFLAVFGNFGLAAATLQQEKITSDQVSTLFWLNIVFGIILGLVAAALGPLVAWFYGEPRLALVTAAIGGTFVFAGMAGQPTALMQRGMRYKTLAIVDVGAFFAGTVIAVGMAFAGCGYWSLVGLVGGQSIAQAIFSLAACGWKPGAPKRKTGTRKMLAFGGNLAGASFLNYAIRNADNVILGHAAGADALGIYGRAYRLLTLPLNQFLGPISAVTQPGLCRLAKQPEAFRDLFLKSGRTVTLLVIPVTLLLFCIAPEMVRIVLGPGWGEAAVVFRVLAPGAIISSVNIAGSWVCTPLGMPRRALVVAAVAAPLYILAFWIGSHWGAVGVAASFSIACAAMRVPVFAYMLRGTPISVWDATGKLMGKPFLVGTVACAISLSLGSVVPQELAVQLIVKSLGFAAVLGVAHFTKIMELPISTLLNLIRRKL